MVNIIVEKRLEKIDELKQGKFQKNDIIKTRRIKKKKE